MADLSNVVALGHARIQAWHTVDDGHSRVANSLGATVVAFEIMVTVFHH